MQCVSAFPFRRNECHTPLHQSVHTGRGISQDKMDLHQNEAHVQALESNYSSLL